MRYATYSDERGFAPVLIAIIVAIGLVAGGAVFYLAKQKGAPGGGRPAAEEGAGKAPGAGRTPAEQLDGLTIDAPRFAAPSASPMPGLAASALNVTSPSLPGQGIFKDFAANTDMSYAYTLDIPVPKVELTIPEIATPPSGGQAEGGTEGSTDGSTDGGTGGSPQAQVNASNCAQFSSMPSAQYCSSVGDPNGKTLCEQCKAAGY